MEDIDQIIDEHGDVRRLGSLTPQPGFVSAFNTFEAEHPRWEDDDIRRVMSDPDRSPRRTMFGNEWIQNQKSHGCHDDKTEVLTETGWQMWSDYNGRDLLGTVSPVTHEMEFQAPTRLYAGEYEGPLVYSTNRSLNFALTPNHRMYVRKWSEPKRTLETDYRFTEIGKIGWYSGILESPTGFRGVNIERISIPGSREYLGNDFVAMVALVVSDGWAGREDSTDGNQNKISFCCFNAERYPMVAALAHRIGFSEVPGRTGVWVVADRELAKWFRANIYTGAITRSPFKKLPAIIKTLGMEQIRHFITFYGDKNHVRKDTLEAYYTSSKRLADDLQALLMKLGKRSSITPTKMGASILEDGRTITAKHQPYLVNVYLKKRPSIARNEHLSTGQYKGLVYCATVPNGTLITRRDDSVLISGNSCNGYAGALALSKARSLRGLNDGLILSGAFVYSRINGGRDNGSALEAGMRELEATGAPSAALVTWDMIYPGLQPANAVAEAAKHKGLACYAVQTKQGFRTALAAGFPVIVAVQAGQRFQTLNGSGIAGADSGGGNHAVHCDDILTVNGTEVYDLCNSWGLGYGRNGRSYVTWDSFAATFGVHTFYAVASTEERDQ